MDYEKAYKAAKRVAAHWIENGCEATEKILLETIFPELKESEDEKMWKRIIDHFDWHSQAPYLTHQECDEIKAFLEKQKELLHVSETYKENADSFIDGDERIRKALIEFLREAYSRGNAPEECAKWLVCDQHLCYDGSVGLARFEGV